MKLVMTILVRDEAEIIDAQIAFHLNAGVDYVIATDNESQDDTVEILESYARDGYLHLIHEPAGVLLQAEWATRMARLAASDFGADWVINSDADEFWWPRGGSLRDVLGAVPERYGIVSAPVRPFVPRPPDGAFFAERMTVRLSPPAPINDPAGAYRPYWKVMHRADPRVVVGRGAHALLGSPLEPLLTWHPIELLHFPIRTVEQCAHKATLQWNGFVGSARGYGTAFHAKSYRAHVDGLSGEYYDSLAVDDDVLAQGLSDGSLVVDTRLRDALRKLRATGANAEGRAADSPPRFVLPTSEPRRLLFPKPGVVEDVGFAVEVAVLREAERVRHLRQLDAIEARLERRSSPRLAGAVRRLAPQGRAAARSRTPTTSS
jgi:Glycosyl transferase family 2